jgi:septal ring factor EnvC (AmiA/AmiB activator)
MAKKQINVFGASFLDLLSGALGAVIILYVIVPKMEIPVEEFEEQQRIAEEIAALGVSIEEISNMIPQADYDQLLEQLSTIEETNSALQRKIRRMETRLEQIESSPDQEDLIAELERQITELEEQVENVRSDLSECEAGRADCEEDLEKIEGDARFLVVVMSWSTANHDVDLHVVDPDGNEFMYNSRTFEGVEGELTVDNTCGPGYEVWNIAAPKEGEYEIYTNLFSRNGCEGGNPENGMAEVTIYHRNGVQSYDSIELVNEQEKVLISTANIPGSGIITFN